MFCFLLFCSKVKKKKKNLRITATFKVLHYPIPQAGTTQYQEVTSQPERVWKRRESEQLAFPAILCTTLRTCFALTSHINGTSLMTKW